MKRIFITGCAHTGTTLLRRLFYAFESVEVVDHEIRVDKFSDYESTAPILVGKRTADSIYSNALPEMERRRQHLIVRSNRILVVNMLRQKDGVVKSVPAYRYDACMNAVFMSKYPPPINIWYEFLVDAPDAVQSMLALRLGLVIKHKFSDYPSFLPPHLKDVATNEKAYNLRPIGEPV